LTWQTDAAGRLLAGPGTSLSQALGRGGPMQPALLGELFSAQGPLIDDMIKAGRPISGVPVETVATSEGVSFVGTLFGAPVLDNARRPTGYRGFLVVTDAKQTHSFPSAPVRDRAEPESVEVVSEEPVQAKPAAADSPSAQGGPSASGTARREGSSETDGAGEIGRLQASLGALAAPLRDAASEVVGAMAGPRRTVEVQSRHSNVIALRLPNADVARAREPESPALSPAERDAFADIARALGATWSVPAPRPAAIPSPGAFPAEEEEGRDELAASGTSDRAEHGEARASEFEEQGPGGRTADAQTRVAEVEDRPGFGDADRDDLVSIIDRLPVGVLVHRDGSAVSVNKTLLDLLGHENLAAFEAHGGIDKLFADHGERDAAHPGVAIRARDGEVIAVDARCQAIKWRGEAATLLSLRRSLSSQAKALEASYEVELTAKQSEIDDLRAILEGAIDGAVTVDALGRILAMNHSAEKLFGYGGGEIAGEALAILIAPEGHHVVAGALAATKEADRALHPQPQEITGRDREGRRIPLSMRLFSAGAAHPSARLYAIFADLTSAKASEAAQIEARVGAERTTAQKSEFLAKVSHEIRTPLNSIVGFADIIAEERFGPLNNERYKEYLQDIRASGTHIISLVNDLLDLSKIEAGRMELNFTNVSLNAEVTATVALVQAEAARSRVLMRQSLTHSLPAIIADQRSVKQIVLNILSNAVKFTEPGGQVIVSTALSDKGEVILRVRDTGIGMSERELAEAMEPFRQFATTQRPGGSGLGLSLTKALVKANKASLSITSASNEGTLVEIVFPRERVVAI
jgi:PAS domain S-box-containing protein